jgi:hypothetical protein
VSRELEADPSSRGLIQAAHALASPAAWQGAFDDLDEDALAFVRAVLRAWVEGPTLAQVKGEVEALLGLFVVFAHLLAAYARVLASGALKSTDGRRSPDPSDVNAAAKDLGLFLRDPATPRLVRDAAPDLRAVLAGFALDRGRESSACAT